jgi:hypothetical protein
MPRRQSGRRIAKNDIPPDILGAITQRARCLQNGTYVISSTSINNVNNPNSMSDVIRFIDPDQCTDPNVIISPSPSNSGPSASLPSYPIHKLPLACQPLAKSNNGISTYRHTLGPFNVICSSCHAIHWMEERLTTSSRFLPKFGMCCHSGNVYFPVMSDPPQPLYSLLDGTNIDSGIIILYHIDSPLTFRGSLFPKKYPKL